MLVASFAKFLMKAVSVWFEAAKWMSVIRVHSSRCVCANGHSSDVSFGLAPQCEVAGRRAGGGCQGGGGWPILPWNQLMRFHLLFLTQE